MQMSVFFHTQKKKKNIIRRASNSRVCFSGPGKVCESIEKKKVVFLFLVYFLQDSPVFFFFCLSLVYRSLWSIRFGAFAYYEMPNPRARGRTACKDVPTRTNSSSEWPAVCIFMRGG